MIQFELQDAAAHVLGAGGHILLWCCFFQHVRAKKFKYNFRMNWWRLLAPLCVFAAWFSRGWFDDLSITTLVLMTSALMHSKAAPASTTPSPVAVKRGTLLAACVVCIVSGALLYLTTLGLLPWSIYQAGPGLVPVFLSSSLLALFVFPQVGRAMILALLAYALRLGFSDNPWDYLMDPLLWFYSFYRLWRLVRSR